MTSNEIRSSFLQFFERHRHRVVPSSSLVPANDPPLLFTNAGMNQFKDAFLGKERRDYTRATTAQKCMRVSGKHNDLENVGPSLRHHTFFEMLGNFSFGDYFKTDAITFAWTLLTEEWKVPADRMFATVFRGEQGIPRDDEAYGLWERYIPADRIAELGLADNFWAMGETGPCGRCSEVHYFRGLQIPCSEPVCQGVGCSCDRFVEIWNNVFMEFDRQADGALHPLPAPSIDTGMGLERITALLQGKLSNYDTDLFQPLIGAIGDFTGARYGSQARVGDASRDASIRVVADHARAMTFLIADGVLPSNEWRGYVLRKIMRRAMRHGKRLGMTDPFIYQLVDILVRQMGDAVPELKAGRDSIVEVVRSEEDRFDGVLNDGLPRLEVVLAAAAAGDRVVPGEEAFRLYDTYGLPLDFIEDLAGERRLAVDHDAFERAMEAQRQKARASSGFGAGRADSFHARDGLADKMLRAAGDTFEGYTTIRVSNVPIVAVFAEDRNQVSELREGQTGFIALARTPFYLEAGGQVSDIGHLFGEPGSGTAAVEDVVPGEAGWPRLHRVRVISGLFRDRDEVRAEVDAAGRDAIKRNHTATHLLHAALRRVLGPHVKQAGSLVAPDRLRFDFVNFSPVTPEQVEVVERIVNEQISRNAPVQTEVRATEEAVAAGAMALFSEKYADQARVVSVPEFSLELCGGTHCDRTGDIGFFTITGEGGVAAGVRRIEALTGHLAVREHQARRNALEGILATLGAPETQAVDAIERLQLDVKRLGRENSHLKLKAALAGGTAAGPAVDETIEIGTAKVLTRKVAGLERDALRGLADTLKERIGSGVIVLGNAGDGRAAVVVAVTPDFTDRVHAGNLVKQLAPIIGGGGGGRPEFAEAGGKEPGKIDELLAAAERLIRASLTGPGTQSV